MPHFNTDVATNRDGRHHSRRKLEQPWRSWYKSPIWKSIRRHRLIEEPRCRQCAIEGRTVAASHVGHIEPHLGEWSLFIRYGNTQSLCVRHHNMHRQQEARGLLTGLDINGQPIIHNPGRYDARVKVARWGRSGT